MFGLLVASLLFLFLEVLGHFGMGVGPSLVGFPDRGLSGLGWDAIPSVERVHLLDG